MNERLVRRMPVLLNGAAIVILIGSGALLIQLLRPQPAWSPPETDLTPDTDVQPSHVQARSLSDLAVIWQRDLRQAVVDPPADPQPQTDTEPKLAVVLLGTAIEADRQYGIFRNANGATVVKPAGAVIDEYEVMSITRGRARLRNGQREYDLTVPWYDSIRSAEGD